ncbi:hypothetical protein RHSIM_Rhsim03G0099200 [Rhododendron simsii]|uniref:Uncharacterized protein n=1 Tax=Rhododendron simsii TaxID=118357 RepID=A0A834HAY1_RHOSS|nr:hypothetical protein RHSIM_Rhsim03G0099200 [Rhododendron simsii]
MVVNGRHSYRRGGLLEEETVGGKCGRVNFAVGTRGESLMLLSLSRRRRQPRVRLQNVQPEVPVLPSTRQTDRDFLHVQAPEKPNECSICGLEFAIGQALGHRPTTDGKAEQRTGPVWSIRLAARRERGYWI